jgi:hypothetical protein
MIPGLKSLPQPLGHGLFSKSPCFALLVPASGDKTRSDKVKDQFHNLCRFLGPSSVVSTNFKEFITELIMKVGQVETYGDAVVEDQANAARLVHKQAHAS